MIVEDYEQNALAITDEEVVADWRKGMIRTIARNIAAEGHHDGYVPYNSRTRHPAHWTPGTLGRHVHVAIPNGALAEDDVCEIVSMTHIEELNMEQYHWNSFGPDIPYTETGVAGIATCNHGFTGKMTRIISVGNLISLAVNEPDTRGY